MPEQPTNGRASPICSRPWASNPPPLAMPSPRAKIAPSPLRAGYPASRRPTKPAAPATPSPIPTRTAPPTLSSAAWAPILTPTTATATASPTRWKSRASSSPPLAGSRAPSTATPSTQTATMTAWPTPSSGRSRWAPRPNGTPTATTSPTSGTQTTTAMAFPIWWTSTHLSSANIVPPSHCKVPRAAAPSTATSTSNSRCSPRMRPICAMPPRPSIGLTMKRATCATWTIPAAIWL